jgi:mono/diheme cytochrome c family protein
VKRVLFIGLVLQIAACATSADNAAPVVPGEPADRLAAGRALYSARCQSCHSLPVPAQLTPQEWPAEVAGMARKSGLVPEQIALVSDYLVAASRATR